MFSHFLKQRGFLNPYCEHWRLATIQVGSEQNGNDFFRNFVATARFSFFSECAV
jgi:hypothetical protein